MDHNCQEAMEELIKVREMAARLDHLTRDSYNWLPEVRELVEGVGSSTARAIQALGSADHGLVEPHRSPAPIGAAEEASGKKRKGSGLAGRGGYRKRKQMSEWRTVTSNTPDDEFSWRKYGQKPIHGTKFPKSYYRCAFKSQGCDAVKQVQKSDADPCVFEISYMGQHSCSSKTDGFARLASELNTNNSTSMLSFESNTSNAMPRFCLPSSSFMFSKKQETDEEVLSKISASAPPASDEFGMPSLGDGTGEEMRFVRDDSFCVDDLLCLDDGDFKD